MAKYSDIKHAQIKRARSATKNLNKAMDVFVQEGLKFFGIDKKSKGFKLNRNSSVK